MEKSKKKYQVKTPSYRKEGGPLKKLSTATKNIIEYALGTGVNGVGKPKPTLYVKDKKDPRYVAYQDSLTLYNATKGSINKLKESKNQEDWFNYTKDWGKKYMPTALPAAQRLTKLNKTQPQHAKSAERFNGAGYAGEFKEPTQPVKIDSSNDQLNNFERTILTPITSMAPSNIVGSSFDISASVPNIHVPVRSPKYWKVEDTIQGGVDYQGNVSQYQWRPEHGELPELAPANKRVVKPMYALGTGPEGIDPPTRLAYENELLSKVINQKNKHLNFVDRGLNPDKYPSIKDKDGNTVTHQMGYGEDDNGNQYIYPNVVQKKDGLGLLNWLDEGEATEYAKSSGEFIKLSDPQLANYYTENGLIKHALGTGKDGIMKNKKITPRQRYANGTTSKGVGPTNYIPNPHETLADYQIMVNKAEGEAVNNGWVQGLAVAAPLIEAGVNIAGRLVHSKDDEPAPKAMGDSNVQDQMIEAEGGEVMEDPQTGEVQELQGPSHAEGGIPMEVGNMPGQVKPGTVIYSEQLEGEDGKTMAERKKERTAQEDKLDKLLSEKKGDIAVKNAVMRRKAALAQQDEQDLKTQEHAQMQQQMQQQMMQAMMASQMGEEAEEGDIEEGVEEAEFEGGEEEVQQYALGTDEEGVRPQLTAISPMAKPELVEFNKLNIGDLSKRIQMEIDASKRVPPPTTAPSRDLGYLPKMGDIMGLVGNYNAMTAPMKNTLENRAGDKPHQNFYRDFGKDALKVTEQSKDLVAGVRDNTLKRIEANARGSKRAGRNGARGINQIRMSDYMADMGANQTTSDIQSQYATQMMQILAGQAGLENAQDQAVMKGEADARMADEMARDNFYSQYGKDKATFAQGLQQTGKDFNQMAMNPMVLNLLKEIGKYVTVDAQGNVIAKKS